MGKKVFKVVKHGLTGGTVGKMVSSSDKEKESNPSALAEQQGSTVSATDATSISDEERKRRNSQGPITKAGSGTASSPLGTPTVLGG